MAEAEDKGTPTTRAPTSVVDVVPKTRDGRLEENSKENLDEKLDHAVDETFPASDPVSVKITK